MDSEILLKFDFLTLLAKSFHQSGTGAHELETDLMNISSSLSVHGDFFITPTSISLTLSAKDASISKNMRLFPTGASISRMNYLRDIARKATTQEIDLNTAIQLIKEGKSESFLENTLAILTSFSLVSSCLAILMEGGLTDFSVALITGFVTGFLTIFLNHENIIPIKETLIAFTVTFIVFLVKAAGLNIDQNTVILSSLIVLIPGLSFTIALSELSNKHMSSGTARMMGAIIDFFKLGSGIIAGHYFALNFLSLGIPIYSWDFLMIPKSIAVLICSAAAAIIFNAAKNEILWIIACAMIVVHSLDFFEAVGSSNLAIFFSSFIAGILSNFYARFQNKSANTLLLPSIVFLVPGAIGLKGINLILDNNVHSGGEQIGASILAAGLIVAGIFFADALFPTSKINFKKP